MTHRFWFTEAVKGGTLGNPNPPTMKAIPTSALAALLCVAPACPLIGAPDAYVPGPDSAVQPGVPQGELIAFDFSTSKVFPGTTRHVTVYVPKQYDPAKAACLYVGQDGVGWNAPIVMDNLIARGEILVMIGVFVTSGGVQVCDQAGRVNAILPSPGGPVIGVCLGGKDFGTLYAASAETIYIRKVNAVGANTWASPVLPAAPKL
jgi:hypothetical protein